MVSTVGLAPPLLLTLLQALSTHAVGHYCTVPIYGEEEIRKNCTLRDDLLLEDYHMDRIASGLDDLDDQTLDLLLKKWERDGISQVCVFKRKTKTENVSCCGGWTGEFCDKPVCDPACEHGECVQPSVCKCEENYGGLACQEDIREMTDELQYCYERNSCWGGRPEQVQGVTSKTNCCQNGGKSWGLGGNKCQTCFNDMSYLDPASYTPDLPSVIPNTADLPMRTCMTYGPNYHRTFDGLEYLYPGRCLYTMYYDGTHRVMIDMKHCYSYTACKKRVHIELPLSTVIDATGGDINISGQNITILDGKGYASHKTGISIERKGEWYFLTYNNLLYVRWDTKSTVFISLTKEGIDRLVNNKSHIQGLCGNFNGIPYDDMQTRDGKSLSKPTEFGNEWIEQPLDGCAGASPYTYKCKDTTMESKAIAECGRVLTKPFTECRSKVQPDHYYIRCVSDYCGAGEAAAGLDAGEESKRVVCETLSLYSQQCGLRGVEVPWRSDKLCPESCPNNMTFTDCAPKCPATCRSLGRLERRECEGECYPGCACPPGTVLHGALCIPAEQCPCEYQSHTYLPGEVVDIGCNHCKCTKGRWVCTEEVCAKTCTINAYNQITTLDGNRYEFDGPNCVYTLVELNDDAKLDPSVKSKGDVTIQRLVSDCPSGIPVLPGEGGDVGAPVPPGAKRCVTSEVLVTYKRGDDVTVVRIENDLGVLVNGKRVLRATNIYHNEYLSVRLLSSVSVVVQGFGFTVSFDMLGRIYVTLDPFFMYRVRGMCGNMDGSQADDFTSRQNIEETIIPFAMSYSNCVDRSGDAVDSSNLDMCQHVPAAADDYAKEKCSLISDVAIFGKDCLSMVDLSWHKRACLKDSCSSPSNPKPICSALASLARVCAQRGVLVDWMKDIRVKQLCGGLDGLMCPVGSNQNYKECVKSVTSCRGVQFPGHLPPLDVCVPGCACPTGLLSDDQGHCVTLDNCTCFDQYSNQVAKPLESAKQVCSVCVCRNAEWDCGAVECASDVDCPNNQIFRTDLSPCGETCESLTPGDPDSCEAPVEWRASMQTGCGCPPQQVLLDNGTCVEPDYCPCMYNGEHYESGSIIEIGCQIYECKKRVWVYQSSSNCSGDCHVYGEAHYRTFDGMRYDLETVCEYTLVERVGVLSVTARNLPCGPSGIACTKTLKVKVGESQVEYLGQGSGMLVNQIPVDMERGYEFKDGRVFSNGLLLVMSFKVGLDIVLDQGTLVHIVLSEEHKSKVRGMCGNFDDNAENDDDIMDQGVISQTPKEFSQLYKISDSCLEEDLPVDFDPCKNKSDRFNWAKGSCDVIQRGELFSECRARLRPAVIDGYYSNCVYDACSCDIGGDCECICTAVAAFAIECGKVGVFVDWRSNNFCPKMCPEDMEYKSCGPVCPNMCPHGRKIEEEGVCERHECVEGCYCPHGFYQDVLDPSKCLMLEDCPCEYEGTYIPVGTSLTINCRQCECKNGSVQCKGRSCGNCSEAQSDCASRDQCVLKMYNCDGVKDCRDGSDEFNCSSECPKGMFQCYRYQECVPRHSLCDGVYDCSDGSDEYGCEEPCPAGFFQCKNSRCIDESFLCDMKVDCDDSHSSDELNCAGPCPPGDYFRCNNDMCLPSYVVCDGHDDCGDGFDEKICYECSGTVRVLQLDADVIVNETLGMSNTPGASLSNGLLNVNIQVGSGWGHTVTNQPGSITDPDISLIHDPTNNNKTIAAFRPGLVLVFDFKSQNYSVKPLEVGVKVVNVSAIYIRFLDEVSGAPIIDGDYKWTNPDPDYHSWLIAELVFSRQSSGRAVMLLEAAQGSHPAVEAVRWRFCLSPPLMKCPTGRVGVQLNSTLNGLSVLVNDEADGSRALLGSNNNLRLHSTDYLSIRIEENWITDYDVRQLELWTSGVSGVRLEITDSSNIPENIEVIVAAVDQGWGRVRIPKESRLFVKVKTIMIFFISSSEEVLVKDLSMLMCTPEDAILDWKDKTATIPLEWRTTPTPNARCPYGYKASLVEYGNPFFQVLINGMDDGSAVLRGSDSAEALVSNQGDLTIARKNFREAFILNQLNCSIRGVRVVNMTLYHSSDSPESFEIDLEGNTIWKKMFVDIDDDYMLVERIQLRFPHEHSVIVEVKDCTLLTCVPVATTPDCEYPLQIDYRSKVQFSLTYSPRPHIELDAKTALLYSNQRLTISGLPLEQSTISFEVTEPCPGGDWEVTYVNFVTMGILRIRVMSGEDTIYNWIDMSQADKRLNLPTSIENAGFELQMYCNGDISYISELTIGLCCRNSSKTTMLTSESTVSPTTQTLETSHTTAVTTPSPVCEHLTTLNYWSSLYNLDLADETGVPRRAKEAMIDSPAGYFQVQTSNNSWSTFVFEVTAGCAEDGGFVVMWVDMRVRGAKAFKLHYPTAPNSANNNWTVIDLSGAEINKTVDYPTKLLHVLFIAANESITVYNMSVGICCSPLGTATTTVSGTSTLSSSRQTTSGLTSTSGPPATGTTSELTSTRHTQTTPTISPCPNPVHVDYNTQRNVSVKVTLRGNEVEDARQALLLSPGGGRINISAAEFMSKGLQIRMNEPCVSGRWSFQQLRFTVEGSRSVIIARNDGQGNKIIELTSSPAVVHVDEEIFSSHIVVGFQPLDEFSTMYVSGLTVVLCCRPDITTARPTSAMSEATTTALSTATTSEGTTPTIAPPCVDPVALDYESQFGITVTLVDKSGERLDAKKAMLKPPEHKFYVECKIGEEKQLQMRILEVCDFGDWSVMQMTFIVEGIASVEFRSAQNRTLKKINTTSSSPVAVMINEGFFAQYFYIVLVPSSKDAYIYGLTVELCCQLEYTTIHPQTSTKSEMTSGTAYTSASTPYTPLITTPSTNMTCPSGNPFVIRYGSKTTPIRYALSFRSAVGSMNVPGGDGVLKGYPGNPPVFTQNYIQIAFRVDEPCSQWVINSVTFSVDGADFVELTYRRQRQPEQDFTHSVEINGVRGFHYSMQLPLVANELMIVARKKSGTMRIYDIEITLCCGSGTTAPSVTTQTVTKTSPTSAASFTSGTEPTSVSSFASETTSATSMTTQRTCTNVMNVDYTTTNFDLAITMISELSVGGQNFTSVPEVLNPARYTLPEVNATRFTIELKILELCETAWVVMSVHFVSEMIVKYNIKIDNYNTGDVMASVTGANYIEGYWPGNQIDINVLEYTRPVSVYDLRLRLCCAVATTTVSTGITDTTSLQPTTAMQCPGPGETLHPDNSDVDSYIKVNNTVNPEPINSNPAFNSTPWIVPVQPDSPFTLHVDVLKKCAVPWVVMGFSFNFHNFTTVQITIDGVTYTEVMQPGQTYFSKDGSWTSNQIDFYFTGTFGQPTIYNLTIRACCRKPITTSAIPMTTSSMMTSSMMTSSSMTSSMMTTEGTTVMECAGQEEVIHPNRTSLDSYVTVNTSTGPKPINANHVFDSTPWVVPVDKHSPFGLQVKILKECEMPWIIMGIAFNFDNFTTVHIKIDGQTFVSQMKPGQTYFSKDGGWTTNQIDFYFTGTFGQPTIYNLTIRACCRRPVTTTPTIMPTSVMTSSGPLAPCTEPVYVDSNNTMNVLYKVSVTHIDVIMDGTAAISEGLLEVALGPSDVTPVVLKFSLDEPCVNQTIDGYRFSAVGVQRLQVLINGVLASSHSSDVMDPQKRIDVDVKYISVAGSVLSIRFWADPAFTIEKLVITLCCKTTPDFTRTTTGTTASSVEMTSTTPQATTSGTPEAPCMLQSVRVSEILIKDVPCDISSLRVTRSMCMGQCDTYTVGKVRFEAKEGGEGWEVGGTFTSDQTRDVCECCQGFNPYYKEFGVVFCDGANVTVATQQYAGCLCGGCRSPGDN